MDPGPGCSQDNPGYTEQYFSFQNLGFCLETGDPTQAHRVPAEVWGNYY